MFEKLNNSEKDIYKVLVQTAENKLPTPDKPWNGVIFKKEAVENAVDGLKNKVVYDNTVSGHSAERGETNHTKFARVIDSEVDENGNAYAYLNVFNKDYVPLMDDLLENYKNNVKLDEGFSTELGFNDGGYVLDSDNVANFVDYNYTGLSLETNVRDFSGVEGKIVNSIIPSKIKTDGGKDMGEPIKEPVISNTKAMKLVEDNATLMAEKKVWESTEKTYKDKISSLESELKSKTDEISKLNNSISEYKKSEEKEAETLVNSILEKVPDENKESVKAILEKSDLDTLKLMNSMGVNEDGETLNNGGVTGFPPNHGNNKPKAGKSAYEQKHGVDISATWGDDE